MDLSDACTMQQDQQVNEAANLAIVFTSEGPGRNVVLDETLMRHILGNLISNAIKYSPQGGRIEVSLQVGSAGTTLRVSDQGIGIPPEDIDHIFERFYTVDKAHSKKMGGTGLGLSLVETIVRKHFGSIECVSEVGKGSVFIVLLPLSLNRALPFNEKEGGDREDERRY